MSGLKTRPAIPCYEKPPGACPIPLDKNENLVVSRDLVLEVVERALRESDVRLYPAPEDEEELSRSIAELYGVDPDMVVLTSGADEAVSLVLDFVRMRVVDETPRLLTLKPTYIMYGLLGELKGFRVEYTLLREEDFGLDYSDFASKARVSDVVFVCNPNNPTGSVIESGILEEVAESSRGLLVVDETYLLFSDNPRSLAGRDERIIVIGTFSKAFGLAGLRLGYVIAEQDLADAIRALRLPYSVNSIALRAGLWALRRFNEFSLFIEKTKSLRRLLVRELSEIRGLSVRDTQTNFIIAKSSLPARRLASETRSRGVCIRVYEDLFKTGDSYIRVTVPPEALIDKVVRVIRDGVEAIEER